MNCIRIRLDPKLGSGLFFFCNSDPDADPPRSALLPYEFVFVLHIVISNNCNAVKIQAKSIILMFDGNIETGAHVKSNLRYLICSKHI